MRNSSINKSIKDCCNILIIEDHKFLSDTLKMVLNLIPQNQSLLKFNIDQALDYESGLSKIEETKTKEFFNVVILDISLGKSKDGEKRTGEELGILIRKHTPKTKIIVLTSHSDGFRINSIMKNINPEGFLIKNNASDHKLFQEVIIKILKGQTYYCNTVSDILRRENRLAYKLDDIDIKILYELSIATRKKDMPNYIPLQLRSIEKRHRRLKEVFEVDSDRNLVLKAKENGFL